MWPYAGVAIAGALIAAQIGLTWNARRTFSRSFFREAPVFAGILWLIFNAFELQMSAIATRTGNSDSGMLRLDLIVLVPILYVLTVAGLLSLWKQLNRPAEAERHDKGR
jgi:uncharacterized membrane protein